jgi:hypothetical protein
LSCPLIRSRTRTKAHLDILGKFHPNTQFTSFLQTMGIQIKPITATKQDFPFVPEYSSYKSAA